MVGARSVLLFVSAVFALGLFGFAQSGSSGSASPVITGTVTYQARMALPSNAAINVRLEDVTLADAPAKLVADNMFSAAGQQVPISFQLPYSLKDVNPSHRYVVRATIKSGDKLLFTTTQAYPVLTNGAPNTVALVLKPVGGAPAAAKLAAGGLRGTYWMLTELHGKVVTPASNNPAYIYLDPTATNYFGSSGCNRISGTFQLSGNSLQLLGGATTLMACPEPLMKQEQEFSKALTATGSYQINGNVLELLERKRAVARFEPGKPQQ